MSFSLADALTLISLIVPILVPLGMALYQHLLDGLPANQRAVVSQVVDNAVTAVEQMVGSGSGPLKKANATELVNAMLASRHIHVAPAEVSALIECGVAALNAARDAKPKPIGFGASSQTSAPAIAPAGNEDPGTLVVPAAVPAPAGIVGLVASSITARVAR